MNKSRKGYIFTMKLLMWLSVGITAALVLFLLGYILVKGIPHITWELLSTKPSYIEERIGILPNILNTLYIILATLVFVIPLGVGAAIYLTEYAKNKRIVTAIEYAAETLSGIPSIIYGLVGMLFFCQFLNMKGCYFNVNTTKTPAGNRQVPMLDFVKEAFLMEKERQEMFDLHCEIIIDGYSDFIFINRFGQTQHQSTLNKAIRRIIRDCNDEQLLKDTNTKVLLPHFSCHSLRHTFTTRMCEAGVNVKVIQDALGHKDISTTLNIYTDVTKELKRSEFEGLDLYFKNE